MDKPFRNNEGRNYTVDFYIGLLEGLLVAVRDEKFPELKFKAERDKMAVVSGTQCNPPDVMDVIKGIFNTSWVTYDPLEQFLNGKLSIGLLKEDGTHEIAVYNSVRMMQDNGDSETHKKLFFWSLKYYKALDAIFADNLTLRAEILQSTQTPAREALKKG